MFLAGIKKELRLFTRGFRLWGILLTVVGIALMYPGMYKLIEVMAEMLKQLDVSMGEGVTQDAANSMLEMLNSIAALYGGELISVGFYTGILSFTTEGFLIAALLLMATAGGEQKKRSIIMPNCAGLTPAGYVIPKFVLYPLLIGTISFLGCLLTAFLSQLMFGGALATSTVMIGSACISIYMVFMTAVYFLFGIATGRPGVGVVVMYLGASLLPTLLEAFKINKYSPFALRDMFMKSVSELDMSEFWLSVMVTVVLSVICCLATLVVVTLRRVDNTSGEANL